MVGKQVYVEHQILKLLKRKEKENTEERKIQEGGRGHKEGISCHIKLH